LRKLLDTRAQAIPQLETVDLDQAGFDLVVG
jgi:hypothetical protein